MTGQEIIDNFETYVDDSSELSPVQELALLNKVYRIVLNQRPWEFLKKEFVGTSNGTTSIDLPADFAYMVPNMNYTDNSYETEGYGTSILLGTTRSPYKMVNWSDRNQYQNNSGVCWINIRTMKLEFGVAPATGQALQFDYIYNPDDITLLSSPVFPSRFHDILYHRMAVDESIIELFPKAQSYAVENMDYYRSYLKDMAYWNSQLIFI